MRDSSTFLFYQFHENYSLIKSHYTTMRYAYPCAYARYAWAPRNKIWRLRMRVQLRRLREIGNTRGTEIFSAFMRKFNSELTHVGTININLPKIFSVIYNFGTRATDNASRARESCAEFIKFTAACLHAWRNLHAWANKTLQFIRIVCET